MGEIGKGNDIAAVSKLGTYQTMINQCKARFKN